MSLLLVLFCAYVAVTVTTFVCVRLIVTDKALRSFFALIIFTTPIVAVGTIIYALCGGKIKQRPISENLAGIEQEIESERISLYGGSPLKPPLAEAMQIAYLRSLATAAKTADRVSGSHFQQMVPAA